MHPIEGDANRYGLIGCMCFFETIKKKVYHKLPFNIEF